jgi:gluconokinase
MSCLVVMGVAGCGKSSVAAEVAGRLRWPLVEGDDFHSAANQLKMRSGIPLSDTDRAEWLTALGERLRSAAGGVVLTCSALKRSYRDALRRASPGLRFAWLDLDQAAASARVAQRGASHLFPPSLVASQFEALEPPTGEPLTLRLDALLPVRVLAEQITGWMAGSGAAPSGAARTPGSS